MFGAARITGIIIISCVVMACLVIVFYTVPLGHVSYENKDLLNEGKSAAPSTSSVLSQTQSVDGVGTDESQVFVATHVVTPEYVRGVYFTSWAAGTPSFRAHMFDILKGTTLNTVVIDVKDYSGRISFPVEYPSLVKYGASENRITDIKELIAKLHDMHIYVIARIAVFQDPFMVKTHPEWAVRDSRTGQPWKDSGGALWLDPDNKEVWKYAADIGLQSYDLGFDEINFDYIRFPSDGSISSAIYSKSASTTKASVMRNFFSYLHDQFYLEGIPISADLFGQATVDRGDVGIGQVLENAMPYFDAIAPMVYPSHFAHGFIGYQKPAMFPYQVVKYSMDEAVKRAKAASTSPLIMRPWLQAFDLGAIYTPEMVKIQIKATQDAGLNSWLLWNAGSVYKREAVLTLPEKTRVSEVGSSASKSSTAIANIEASSTVVR